MVGDAYPTVFMAEIGAFFDQDVDLALSYLYASAAAGAAVFKTEILLNPDICLAGTGTTYTYTHSRGTAAEELRSIIERKIVPVEGYKRLFRECHELNLPFVCSVFDTEGIDLVVQENGVGIKIARDNIDNIGLIRYAAATGLVLFFDAGNVTLDELALAVRTARESGTGGIIINHHPAANPAPPEVHHLRVIETYKKMFKVPIGLACHYRGNEIMYAAVGAGVNLIEKGIDADPDRLDLDLISAASLAELPDIVQQVRNCWLALGQDTPQIKEPRKTAFRKCLIAKKDIVRGEKLTIENLGFALPPLGIPPNFWDLIVDKEAARDIAKNKVLVWEDIKM
ncbi:MAG: N-acetylneuraminate synthase family protein [Desulfobaccales bacterium]